MQFKDEGEICSLYIEPIDKKEGIFQVIAELRKPLALIVPAPVSGFPSSFVFGRPEDYSELKHLHRSGDLPPIYLISGCSQFRVLAQRNGIPAYPSSEAFAASLGAVAHTRNGHRATRMQSSKPSTYSPSSQTLEQGISSSLVPPMKPKKRAWLLILSVSLMLLLILAGSLAYLLAISRSVGTQTSTAQTLVV